MITTLDIIDRLPHEMADRLNADSYFCDVPVVVADEGDVEATMAQKQAMLSEKNLKSGIGVVVLQLVADDDSPNLQFGPMTLKPAFQVVEVVAKNRNVADGGTGKPARKVARRIRDVMKTFGLVGFIASIRASKPCILPVSDHNYGANVVMYQVEFECLETSPETQSLVQTPQIARVPNTNTCQITCATPGAIIYYTTDDSYPSPEKISGDNVTCSLRYTEPFDVPPTGLTVRACAYASKMIASWVNRQTVLIN